MKLEEELERDIQQFFQQVENQLPEGKRETLKLLIDKYCHISSTPTLFNKSDFDMIKQFAQRFFVDAHFPKMVGENRRTIEGGDLRVLAIIEGTISYLQSQDCLKKLPKFDYKEK